MTDKTERVHRCGFCITGHHHNCKVSTTYYGKTWECLCECRAGVTKTPAKRTSKKAVPQAAE